MEPANLIGRLRRAVARRRTKMLIDALPADIRRDIGWPEPPHTRLTTGWPHLWSL
jgi:hypothetical protein